MKFLLFPLYLLVGLVMALFRSMPEPPMFVGQDKPNPDWLVWYRYYHRTSLVNAKAAFIALNKRMDEPSYFEEPEKWLEWVNKHPAFEGVDDYRRGLIIRGTVRTMDIRKLAITCLGKEEPEDILSETKDAFNIEWLDYQSSIKGHTLDYIFFKEIQKQIHSHNRFINEVYMNA